MAATPVSAWQLFERYATSGLNFMGPTVSSIRMEWLMTS
jgi:hypothetical protein